MTVYDVDHFKADKTLNSILNQTINVHYVFIDDCGPGEHLNSLRTNWSRSIGATKNEQNEGVGQALNNGLDFALKNVPNWTHFGRIDLGIGLLRIISAPIDTL